MKVATTIMLLACILQTTWGMKMPSTLAEDDALAEDIQPATGKGKIGGVCTGHVYVPNVVPWTFRTAPYSTFYGVTLYNLTAAVSKIRFMTELPLDTNIAVLVGEADVRMPRRFSYAPPNAWSTKFMDSTASAVASNGSEWIQPLPAGAGWVEYTFDPVIPLYQTNLATTGIVVPAGTRRYETAGQFIVNDFCLSGEDPGETKTFATDEDVTGDGYVPPANPFWPFSKRFASEAVGDIIEVDYVPFCIVPPHPTIPGRNALLFPGQTTDPVLPLPTNATEAGDYVVSCASGTPALATLTCHPNGTWSENAHCLCSPPSLPPVTNGLVIHSEDAEGQVVANFSCPEGWYSPGNPVATTTCFAGAWTPSPFVPAYPSCVRVPCPGIPVVHGRVTTRTSAVFGQAVEISCEIGYSFSGASNITCQANGTYTEPPGVCTIVSCNGFDVLERPSDVVFDTCVTSTYRSVCVPDCGSSKLVGPRNKTCNASAVWSPPAVQFCTNVTCGDCPAVVGNSTVAFPDGPDKLLSERCQTVCDPGFTLFGNPFRVCALSEQWDTEGNPLPVCRKNCDTYAPPVDGFFTDPSCDPGNQGQVPFEKVCMAECNVGYGLSGPVGGEPVRTCGGGGSVEGEFSGFVSVEPGAWNCPIVQCGALELGPPGSDSETWNGRVECLATSYLGLCSVFCDPGHVVNGDVNVDTLTSTCQASGEWEAVPLACTPCPEGTFWVDPADRLGEVPVVCTPCPVGGVCDGGLAPPRAAPGWFLNSDGSLSPCVPAGACSGSNVCASGHTGVLCGSCETNHYRADSGECRGCSPATVYLVLALLVFLVLMGVVLFKLAKHATAYFASLSVAFSYFQVLAILSSFELKWPSFVRSFLTFFKVFNFNVALFNPKCAVSGGGGSPFLFVFYGKLLVPIIAFGLFVLAIACIWSYYFVYTRVLGGKSGQRGGYLDDDGVFVETGRNTVPMSEADQVLAHQQEQQGQQGGKDGDEERLGAGQLDKDGSGGGGSCWLHMEYQNALESSWRCVNAFLSFLALVYLLVSSTATQIYACTTQADGRRTLDAESAILCTSSTYGNMRVASILVLIFFSLGLPVVILVTLSLHRFDLWRYRTVALLGLLFQRYSAKFYFFEVAVLLRRFGFVFGQLLFPKSPLGQALVALFSVLCAAGAQARYKPYRARAVNFLEAMCMCFGVVCVVVGIMYFSFGDDMPSGASDALGVVLIVLICGSIVVIFAAIASEVKKQWRLKHHGVRGGFASDQLEVFSAFFETDVFIHRNERFRDGATTMYRISMSTPMETTLSGVLILHKELVDSEAYAWWQLLIPTLGPGARASPTLTALGENVRIVSYDGGRRHDISVLLDRPAHYILSVRGRRVEEFFPRSGSSVVPASERSEDLIDFFISSESGSIPEQAFVGVEDVLEDRDGFVISPAQRVLTQGSDYEFSVYTEGAKHIVVGSRPPVHHTQAENKLLLKGGRHQGRVVLESPGPVAIWVDFGTATFDSISGFDSFSDDEGGGRGRRGSRATEFVPIAWYDVVRQGQGLVRSDVKRYSVTGLEEMGDLDWGEGEGEGEEGGGGGVGVEMGTFAEVDLDGQV